MKKKSAPKPKSPARKKSESSADSHSTEFPVVGIGSSAGGLEALDELLENMPANTGMAFVVVTHQHPGHKSLLPELLAKETKMTVTEAVDGIRLLPNHVYVAPPGGYLAILQGVLHRMEPESEGGLRLPIDYFFRSLAEDKQKQAICIVLSGTGTDGTLGIKAIKGSGGMAMVQQLQSARYSGMPSSALATGLVDYVLAPAAMSAKLIAYTTGPYPIGETPAGQSPSVSSAPMQKIFVLLRGRTGHDFSSYKSSTIRRRIERRMNVHQIGEPEHYVRYLRENPHEIDILFKELLIGVTSFFRDPEAWEAVSPFLEELVKSRPENHVVRVWVPGCATGEEAYTIAILLKEAMAQTNSPREVQIFATDLDSEAIESARAGRYPQGIAADVTRERLNRYFVHEDSTYRIRKEIRETVIFAPQNVVKDPPFTKLDILSCRNLLIYLDAELQKNLLPIFHYALSPGGMLLLGPSESIGTFSDLFDLLVKRWKVFRRKESASAIRSLPGLPLRPVTDEEGRVTPRWETPFSPANRTSTLIERFLLDRFAPASVVVNDHGDILFIHGRTGAFLEPSPGEPRSNIIEMAREGLRIELVAAMRECNRKGTEVVREDISVKSNGDATRITLKVIKIHEPETLRGLFLVSFLPASQILVEPEAAERKQEKGPCGKLAVQLERELEYMKESHQTTLEELETSNEELKSLNEELQSTNEELQSTNEELETSKEEMQSLNEELTTVNSELQLKVDELSHANNDMQNLLNSTEIATVYLDSNLNVRRFTEEARDLVMLRQSDVGRPISELVSKLEDEDLAADCRKVLKTLAFQEGEVRNRDGSWYLMRIMPYRTTENVIDGLVMTFVAINRLKEAESELAGAKERLATELEAITCLHETGSLVVSEDGLDPVLRELLNAAMLFTNADKGTIQLVNPSTGKLEMRAHCGFNDEWLAFWNRADKGEGACGVALKERKRVIIEDISSSPVFVGKPALKVQQKAKVRAVQSTPLVDRSGTVLGVISTHYIKSCRPDQRSLRLMDLLARQAVDVVQRASP